MKGNSLKILLITLCILGVLAALCAVIGVFALIGVRMRKKQELQPSRGASPESTLERLKVDVRKEILLSKESEYGFSRSFLIMSKFLLPKTIRGKQGYAIDLSKLKNFQCVNILTSSYFDVPGVKIFSNEYVDEVVSRMNDELEGKTCSRSLVMDGDVLEHGGSMIVLGYLFGMLPRFCCRSP